MGISGRNLVFLCVAWLAICHPARAEYTRCEKLLAEAAEIQKFVPVACEESKDTHKLYLQSFPEVHEICRRLQAEANSIPTLPIGGENAVRAEIVARKQKHLTERMALTNHISHELLHTPVDNDDPTRPPAEVSSECGTELESYARFRKNALRGVNEFFGKIDQADDALYQQANSSPAAR